MENNDAGLTPPVSKQEDRYDKFKRAPYTYISHGKFELIDKPELFLFK